MRACTETQKPLSSLPAGEAPPSASGEAERIETAFRWRYATKKFDPARRIPHSDWAALENALLLAPSGYGLQPWKFLVIQDPGLRRELTPASHHQTQVEACSHFVVLAARTRVDADFIGQYTDRIAEARGIARASLNGFFDMVVGDLIHGPKSHFQSEWAARQTYIALGTLISAAAMLRIDSCPLEGIEPDAYDRILDLRPDYRAVVACALGYRSPEDKYATTPKVRFRRERILHYL
jgi:nitroreductase